MTDGRLELTEEARILERYCEEGIGPARVEEITPNIFLAIGYDLANTILIRTPAGNLVVDPAMAPTRGQRVKQDLQQKAPGKTRAVIYTHSHIDHLGSTSQWMEEGTQVWATDNFKDHFLKQYGTFQPIEAVRARRHFGVHAPREWLPCGSIGPSPDIRDSLNSGVRLPTHSFSGKQELDFGGMQIVLVEAHGETHDQLFIWIPSEKTLLPGDNIYMAFPNLYTIRGTASRPVAEWIVSLDKMRAYAPKHLVPSHTVPLHGRDTILDTLTAYRDAIQWVYNATVRGTNRQKTADELAHEIELPGHLASHPYLSQNYGQVDWSVRGIFHSALGWFEGNADRLYPLPRQETSRREVELMGGMQNVRELARQALSGGETRWAIHLLAKLRDSGLATGEEEKEVKGELAHAYRALAVTLHNAVGRGYLLESAWELEGGVLEPTQPSVDEEMLEQIELSRIFGIMSTMVRPEATMEVHETLRFVFPDQSTRFHLTIRRGICEVIEGEPLPGTPEPVATVEVDAQTWVRVSLRLMQAPEAIQAGKMQIDDMMAFANFMGRFQLEV